ncbi:hypothetical protein [Marinomonas fungiae]|uniref:Uncharacterized protein n=1 Tax=Marinomonas fungiae TaxID=1137284 RepID=A0A0K6IU43_9GAMM|nr:hypothetical protein [Marinomonas fungiae]CUB06631.1 hypothetical protein Ga0061065_12016 [Marinomonas fungiae]
MQDKTNYNQKTKVEKKEKKKKPFWKLIWTVVRIAEWVWRLIDFFENPES